MATTLANMGIKSWDQSGDPFSYAELAANWILVDVHDHTSGKGIQIPTAGIANLAVTNAKLATSSVDSNKIVDGAVADTDLASPNNGVYRTVVNAGGLFTADATTGVQLFTTSGLFVGSGVSSSVALALFHLQAAAFSVAGKTTRLRVSILVGENATVSGATFTAGLYPVTIAGAADAVTVTAGTVVATSTAAVAAPSTNSLTNANSSDFTMPADGAYALGVNVTGTHGANAAANITARLTFRHT